MVIVVPGDPVPQPVFIIVKQTLPIFTSLSQRYSSDHDITEAVCALLKQSVSTLQDDIRPLSQDVLNMTVACYRASPHTAALDLVKQFFILYGKEADLSPALKVTRGFIIFLKKKTKTENIVFFVVVSSRCS